MKPFCGLYRLVNSFYEARKRNAYLGVKATIRLFVFRFEYPVQASATDTRNAVDKTLTQPSEPSRPLSHGQSKSPTKLCKVPGEITWILVEDLILVHVERGADVEVSGERKPMREGVTLQERKGVPLESDEVGEGSDGKVKHDIHSSCMDGVNHLLPVSDAAPVGIEYAKVEWGITCMGVRMKEDERADETDCLPARSC